MDLRKPDPEKKCKQKQLDFARLILDLSSGSPDPAGRDNIQRSVEAIGEFFAVDAVSIVLFSDDGEKTGEKYLRVREPLGPQVGAVLDKMPGVIDSMRRGESVNIPDASAPADGKGSENNELSRRGIRSLLAVPIIAEDFIPGFIALVSVQQQRAWTDNERSCIEVIARTIAQIIDRTKMEQRLEYLTYHDQLTGLYNRTFFETEAGRLNAQRQLPMSIIMADVNGLKLVNDAFGHKQGDILLKKTADILREACRQEDILVRWGGDEFIILLPRTDQNQAIEICDRIRRLSNDLGKEMINVSLSTGYATKEDPKQSMEEFHQKAEERMIKNKLMEEDSAKGTVLSGLLDVLGANSYETEEHALRMKEMVQALGKQVGISPSEQDMLSLLASLHDIGKAAMPKEILVNPDPLTDAQWQVIKTHPVRGYRIASAIEEVAHVADLIRYHHEWWDGSGYPEGLKGDAIPLLSRITSIVDAYDVMTSQRSYASPVSPQTALSELKRCKGTQFDPELVDVFVQLMETRLQVNKSEKPANHSTVGKDRRSTQRIECAGTGVFMAYETLPFAFRSGQGKNAPPLPVLNFSRRGICFYATEKLRTGNKIKIFLKIGRSRPIHEMEAQVRHVHAGHDRYPYIVGARFTRMSPETWTRLSKIRKKKREQPDKIRNPFEDTRAGSARETRNLLAKWEGRGSRWIQNFTIDRPWRLLWAAEGGATDSFSIDVFKKGMHKNLLRPVNERNFNGVREGAVDINCTGGLLLKVTATGSTGVRWIIVAKDDETGPEKDQALR